MDKAKTFQSAKRDIEKEVVLQNIDLLKQYMVAKTDEEKSTLKSKMNIYPKNAIDMKHSPIAIIKRLEYSLKLAQHKPKNKSFFELAFDKDAGSIKGEFDTFDAKLSALEKNVAEPKKIRERFLHSMSNEKALVQQFIYDWESYLSKHKVLVSKAKKSPTIENYQKLFDALVIDFANDHNISPNLFIVQVVDKWGDAEAKLKIGPKTLGYHKRVHALILPDKISGKEKQKLLAEFLNSKTPSTVKYSKKAAQIKISFNNTKNATKKDFFANMISVLAHEVHHALDSLAPRQGILGPQVQKIDNRTHTNDPKNGYRESATEISSYAVENALYKRLMNR